MSSFERHIRERLLSGCSLYTIHRMLELNGMIDYELPEDFFCWKCKPAEDELEI